MLETTFNKIINGESWLKHTAKPSDFTRIQLMKLQKELSSWKYLTVVECAIWLNLSTKTVYKYIDQGIIVATKLIDGQQNWRVDVEKTKRNLRR